MRNGSLSGLDLLMILLMSLEAMLVSMIHAAVPGYYEVQYPCGCTQPVTGSILLDVLGTCCFVRPY